MTLEEILEEALIPNTHSVFLLGSFEQRVTVHAQQIRALNLIDALLSRDLIVDGSRVAIIGGGVAGVTAAVALAHSNLRFESLDLFEARSTVLDIQRGSCLLYTSPSPRDGLLSRMPSSA